MMPGIINNPHAGAAVAVPNKLAEEVDLLFSALHGHAKVRGLSKAASQLIPGAHRRTNLVHSEAFCKPRVVENLELAAEGAVLDYGSSGSDHDPSSVSLFSMVHDFIENDGACEQEGSISGRSGCLTINTQNFMIKGAVDMAQNMQDLVSCKNSTEEMILRDTQHIVSSLVIGDGHACDDGKVATTAHSCLKRSVMSQLLKMGYNAAICKTKWDHLCGTPAGDYEYIDVLAVGETKFPVRLIVDIDFQGQFEIARPTDEFTAICQLLPPIFVGTAERLKQIIYVMAEATKESLRTRGLHLPPWRKSAYMKAKWFSSYKRTSNTSMGRPCVEGGQHHNGIGLAVRGVGFDARYMNVLEMLYYDAGFLKGVNDVERFQGNKNEITVTMTDWQPPAIAARYVAPRKQGEIMGLTSLLSHPPAS